MDQATLIFPDTRFHGRAALSPVPGSHPVLRVALFAVWLAIVAYLAAHHVVWRDEVRAFSLALTGGNAIEMAKAVHGEGHPLLWYLLLRAAHAIAPVREVLPAVGLAVGIAGAGFFAWRAPFRPLMLAAVLFGGWMTFEYTVMARNYGISMLLMFVIADRFAKRREVGRGGALAMGALLFLLCSTNVPSVILAGGFSLFWLIEIVSAEGWRRSTALRRWSGATALMLAGVAACFATVYPPFNDAAVSSQASSLTATRTAIAALDVGPPFSYLWPEPAWGMPYAAVVLSLLMLSAPLSLARSRSGAIAAIVVLPMMSLFFQLVYAGSYRHQALYLCFVVALHWMVAAGRGARATGELARSSLAKVAATAFTVLLLVQAVSTASLLGQVARGGVEGQSAALAKLLQRPELTHAIIVGVPEVMVEPLRYYATNPTYLMRQHRFGAVTRFTRQSDRHLTLGGILAAARRLRRTSGRPVVLLIQYPLTRDTGEQWWDEGILGDVHVRPGEAAAFLDATRPLMAPLPLLRYGPFDESYGVYLLKPAPRLGA